MASRKSKIARKAKSFLGIGANLKDIGNVAVTALGSNYLANVVTGALGTLGQNRWTRPVIAGLVGYMISSRSKKNATAIGALLIGLLQSGALGSNLLGSLGGVIGGTTNPARGQERMTGLNVLGRLP